MHRFMKEYEVMRAHSAATQIADGYRAGVYLGEQLKPLMPEVVFLFTTIDYADSADILEGLHDGLEKDCIVIGNSGDGFYETEGATILVLRHSASTVMALFNGNCILVKASQQTPF